MKRLLILLSILNFSASAQHWSFQSCIGDYGNGEPSSVVVDNSGEIITCGIFYDTLYLSSGNIPSSGFQDAYLLKYDSTGNILWSIILNGIFNDEFVDIAVDDSNNIYVTATISSTIQIQGTTIIGNGDNGTLFKFSSSGQLIWYVMASGHSHTQQVALDKTGKVYFTGIVYDSVTFATITINNPGGLYNWYLITCDQYSGNVLDGHMISNSYRYEPYEMIADSAGEIYLTGRYYPTNNNPFKFFMQKLASSTSAGWNYDMESTSSGCNGYGLALDPFGKIYFTGYLYNYSNFLGNSLGNLWNQSDAVLVKFDTSGTLEWARSYGTGFQEIGNQVACDDSGNVFWTGSFIDSIVIANTTLYSNYPSGTDIFLVKLDSSGNVLWNKNIGGGLNEYPVHLSYNSNSNVLGITGTFEGPALFETVQLSNVRGKDAFVARLGLSYSANVGINSFPINLTECIAYIQNNLLFISENSFSNSLFYLTDISGRIIKQGKLETGNGQVDISDVNSGVYIVTIISNKLLATIKIIIAHE